MSAGQGRLDGRIAVVSGVGSGLGRSIAEAFAEEGASVVGIDLVDIELPPAGPRLASFHRMDVTSEESWLTLAGALESTPPDVVVNNAGGLLSPSSLHEHTSASWHATLDLNLTSVFYSMRTFIPTMLVRRYGSIINLGSISGLRGQADAPAYQAAKAGVSMLTRNAAIAYARFGIRINTLIPSVIATESLGREADARTASFLARVPLGRAGLPEEVAAAAVFLASDDSSFVTGADLSVDGGYLA